MKIIGLTGGSGAGKTAVSACFQALGAGAVDADAVYRTLCAENREMLASLAAAFGDVLTPEGALDRPKLAKIVFSDPEKLQRLNEITFPYIRTASRERFMELAESGHTIILYDAPTLYQTGADSMCDAVIGVIASRETRIRRIMDRDGLAREAAEARIDAQPDADFYRSRCRFLIENDGTPEELEAQAHAVWRQLQTVEGHLPLPEKEKKSAERKENIVKRGLSFGSALAMVISFTTWRSVFWAVLHGLLGWLYVVYYILFYA